MKKFLTLVVTIIMAVCACFAFTACGNDENTLYVYTNSGFAPFEYVNDNGEVAGVDIDIAKEIGDLLGYKVVVKDVDFGAIFTSVQQNKMAIGLAGITNDTADQEPDGRWTTGNFSINYAESKQYVVVKEADFSGTEVSITELAGMKIGVQTATTGSFIVADAIDGVKDENGVLQGDLLDSGASYVEYKNILVAKDALGGAIDVMIIDELPAQSIALQKAGYKAVPLAGVEKEYFAAYLNKEATELLEQVNSAIQTLIDNGVVDYFMQKHSGTYSVK